MLFPEKNKFGKSFIKKHLFYYPLQQQIKNKHNKNQIKSEMH